ncbi:MAG: dTDP-4-amino-4,6-dideoxygalactose transaminase [Hyphomicrobiales bacterium]|nr:dTDP-4-amino-4,6-dideoxygalactose transaminase [Acidobacteriaceae bacterium]MBV9974058.1 dTDP-4-amino-4,6-dideoxygalactose transaminase [Hyphomicrobiales bacterium]
MRPATKEPARQITFNHPTLAGEELKYLGEVLTGIHLSGNGEFTKRCQALLEELLPSGRALLTHSCTGALEMAAMLAGLGPGDEVIMPSFTFASTANAVVLRGARPVFVDIRPDTLNIDEGLLAQALTVRTKAISVVHYAGVGCEMDPILDFARDRNLLVMEDAAQALCAKYRGRSLGTFGQFAAISFHETKNIISGEGGALIVNDPSYFSRAEIIWEKGTNRSQFWRGEIDKYTWVDFGSSYLPSEVIAAFLLAQLEKSRELTAHRLQIWHRYREAFRSLETLGLLQIPHVPSHCEHNGHIFFVLAPTSVLREKWLKILWREGVYGVIHYVPLHSSPAGRKFCCVSGDMSVTDDIASRLIRLPLHLALDVIEQDRVIQVVTNLARGR